jgi:hypothetical protein
MVHELCTKYPSRYYKNLHEVRKVFIVELDKLNTKKYSCPKLKDIKQIMGETIWEYD